MPGQGDSVAALGLRERVLAFDAELPVERAAMPPRDWYGDPELHALECAQVLGRSWLGAARGDQVAVASSYCAGELLDEPYLVVRDARGALRAFYNVCRHHAARLLDGAGPCERIVCPYHGWSYAQSGRLERAPGMGALAELERGSLDLAPIALAELGPLLLLCLDRNPPDLATALAGLPTELSGERLRELRFVAQRSYTIACNWKIAVENYLDGGYHVPVLHRGLASGLDLDTYRTELHGELVTQSVKALPGDSRMGGAALYVWLYPALMLNRYGPVLDTNRIIPRGPERTEVVFDFFFEPEAASDADFVACSLATSHAIQLEDTEICERVQQGLRSKSFTRGRYAPRFEHGLHHFHRLLARDLRRGLREP